jgi:mannose-1-phosphate guanylyltransferase
MSEKITLEKFMDMNPEIVTALRAAENEFRESCSKREAIKKDQYPNIPQAAIDAAYRLMDRVVADRKKREERERLNKNE